MYKDSNEQSIPHHYHICIGKKMSMYSKSRENTDIPDQALKVRKVSGGIYLP